MMIMKKNIMILAAIAIFSGAAIDCNAMDTKEVVFFSDVKSVDSLTAKFQTILTTHTDYLADDHEDALVNKMNFVSQMNAKLKEVAATLKAKDIESLLKAKIGTKDSHKKFKKAVDAALTKLQKSLTSDGTDIKESMALVATVPDILSTFGDKKNKALALLSAQRLALAKHKKTAESLVKAAEKAVQAKVDGVVSTELIVMQQGLTKLRDEIAKASESIENFMNPDAADEDEE